MLASAWPTASPAWPWRAVSAFIGGIGLTAVATVRPIGRGLGPSRGLVTQGYVVALVEVAVGAALATLFVAGWPPVVEAWPASSRPTPG